MSVATNTEQFTLRMAEEKDVTLILDFIMKLADYEKLSHEVVATEEDLKLYLFGLHKLAEMY